MEITCCKCEHTFIDIVTGDADERMCYNCLDEEYEDNEYKGDKDDIVANEYE
jgi:hypothetical protein